MKYFELHQNERVKKDFGVYMKTSKSFHANAEVFFKKPEAFLSQK